MPSIRKRVYGLIRTTFSPSHSVEDEFYDPQNSNPNSPTEENVEPPSSPTPTAEHSFIYQYLTGRLRRASHPEIYYGKTGVDLPVLHLDEFKPRICAAYTGPDGGLTEVSSVRKCPIASIANLDDELAISLDGDSLCSEGGYTSGQLPHDSTIGSFSLPSSLADSVYEAQDTSVQWQNATDFSYGHSTSLYERHPFTGVKAGHPVADVFGIVSRENLAFLALADGVNWGERARLAGQCAVRGAIDHLNEQFFRAHTAPETTLDVFHVLLGAFHSAHQLILQEGGLLTTLCVAVVCKLRRSSSWVVCVCNVGDSLCFVYSKNGVREVTQGSHDIRQMRDMRDAGGALGPVDGVNPELQNLTCSLTFAEEDDIVFITSDGVSDNFDPVVGKFCVMKERGGGDKENRLSSPTKYRPPDRMVVPNGNTVMVINSESVNRKPVQTYPPAGHKVDLNLPGVEAHQRHELMLLRMDDLLRHGVSVGDTGTETAQDLCHNLVNFAQQLTMAKRRILEDPDLYQGDTKSTIDQRQRRRLVRQKILDMPGKLDHATVVAYTVKTRPPPEEETVEKEEEEDTDITAECNQPVDPESTPVAARRTITVDTLADSTSLSSSSGPNTPEPVADAPTATYTIVLRQEEKLVPTVSQTMTTETEIRVETQTSVEAFDPFRDDEEVLSVRMIDEGSQSSSVNSNLDEKLLPSNDALQSHSQSPDLDLGTDETECTTDFDEVPLPELSEDLSPEPLETEQIEPDSLEQMLDEESTDHHTTVDWTEPSEPIASNDAPQDVELSLVQTEAVVDTRTSAVVESVMQTCDQITAEITVSEPTQSEIDELEALHSQDLRVEQVRTAVTQLNESYYEAIAQTDESLMPAQEEPPPVTARAIYPESATSSTSGQKSGFGKLGGLRESLMSKKKKHERGSQARHTVSVDVGWFRRFMPSRNSNESSSTKAKSRTDKWPTGSPQKTHHGSILRLTRLKGFNFSQDSKLPTTPEHEQPPPVPETENVECSEQTGMPHSASDTHISKSAR